MQEEWKNINSKYKISNHGNIFSEITDKYLKCNSLRGGYKSLTMSIDGKSKAFKVHQLVAKYFLNNKDNNKTCVNHKDGNKLNNHVDNLEWSTTRENNIHAFKFGLNHSTKRRVKQIDLNNNTIKIYETIRGASKETGIDSGGIAKNIGKLLVVINGSLLIKIRMKIQI